MPRTKRTSRILENATLRFSGFRTIDNTLDYGNGFSVAEYEARINNLRREIIQYNGLLSDLDQAAAKINALEQDLKTYSENILLTTQTHYGKTSLEYQKVGGKIRKSSTRKPQPTTQPQPIPTETIPTTPMAAAMN